MKILITDDVHHSLIAGFQKMNYTVDFQPDITLQKVHEIIGDVDGIVINTKITLNRELVSKANKLQVVARLGSGKEIMDLQALQERQIHVITTPEANCNAVAEHALGMLLALLRNIPKASSEVKEFHWFREQNRGFEISNLRFGIIGFGYTGKRFCQILGGFGCEIHVFDPYIEWQKNAENTISVDSLDGLRDCDVISLHMSYLPENKHFINQAFIEGMKKDFWLINTSRGLIVDLQSILHGLKCGKIKGVCLDVLENENLQNLTSEQQNTYRELFQNQNVLLSPHIAGWTIESKENIAKSILDQWPKS